MFVTSIKYSHAILNRFLNFNSLNFNTNKKINIQEIQDPSVYLKINIFKFNSSYINNLVLKVKQRSSCGSLTLNFKYITKITQNLFEGQDK